MFKSSENQQNYYRISSADWEYIVISSSFEEACSQAVKEMIKLKGGDLNLSFTLEASKLSGFDVETNFFYTPSILSDLGLHDLAKSFSEVHDFFLDKGKESY